MIELMRKELCELTLQLQERGILLIIGGGYGLLLKTEYIERSRLRTLFEEIPRARSTNDLDLFLRTEILCSAEKWTQLHEVLMQRDYRPVESAKYYHFVRSIEEDGQLHEIKIDFLGLAVTDERSKLVKQNSRRISPRGKTVDLHAHVTPEAVTTEENLLKIDINLPGAPAPVYVYLPHSFSYLLLKLFAVRDHLVDKSKEKNTGYHAFDIYRIVAMTTEDELEKTGQMRKMLHEQAQSISEEAVRIISEQFSGLETPAMLQLRGHARIANESISLEQLKEFLKFLQEIFETKI